MIPIPAIDLKGGNVVRLLQGDFKEQKIYAHSAAEVARQFELDGARRIHVVDLDGALEGKPANRASIEKIIRDIKVPLEVGGGIRSLDQVRDYIEMGVRWVILGTKACLDRGFLKEAIAEFSDRIIVGIDARGGKVAVDAWTKLMPDDATSLALDVQKFGGKTIIYTDISKDGAMAGPNLKEVSQMADAVTIDVIASGGVSKLDDLSKLLALNKKNISGVIIGKAIYEKKINLKDALDLCLQKG